MEKFYEENLKIFHKNCEEIGVQICKTCDEV